MSVSIVLYPSENSELVASLYAFCAREGFTITAENINVNFKDTRLVEYTVNGPQAYARKKEIPGYDLYTQVTFSMDNQEQSALLELMGMFYEVGVVYAQNKDIFTYYFEDGITPFYVLKTNYDTYMQAFAELAGYKLVSTSPLLEVVLQIYPNSNVKKFRHYSLWYMDPRAEINTTLQELNLLQREGFFVVPESTYAAQVMYQFGFVPLSRDFSSYKGRVEANKFIRGPLVLGTRLDEAFFIAAIRSLDENHVPLVDVKVNYRCDRRTLAGCIFAYVDSACGALANGNIKNKIKNELQCVNIQGKPFPCREGQCTTLSCEMLLNISVYAENKEDEEGWLTLPVTNITFLQQLVTTTEIETRTVSIVAVDDIEKGLMYRVALYKLGFISVLLEDEEGYFVALQNYDGPNLEELQIQDTLTPKEVEMEASLLANYDSFGRGYAYAGIYSIDSLPGLLGTIPVLTTSGKDSMTIQRTKERIYDIATPEGNKIDTLIVNADDARNDINIIYEKYNRQYGNIVVTAWEKTYLESFSGNTFSTTL